MSFRSGQSSLRINQSRSPLDGGWSAGDRTIIQGGARDKSNNGQVQAPQHSQGNARSSKINDKHLHNSRQPTVAVRCRVRVSTQNRRAPQTSSLHESESESESETEVEKKPTDSQSRPAVLCDERRPQTTTVMATTGSRSQRSSECHMMTDAAREEQIGTETDNIRGREGLFQSMLPNVPSPFRCHCHCHCRSSLLCSFSFPLRHRGRHRSYTLARTNTHTNRQLSLPHLSFLCCAALDSFFFISSFSHLSRFVL